MKCFECNKEAVVLLNYEARWEGKLSKNMFVINFSKALCRKHFEELISDYK